MADVLITNARIFDATGAQPFNGEVLVQGNRITQVKRGGGGGSGYGSQQVIDAAGAFREFRAAVLLRVEAGLDDERVRIGDLVPA